MNRLKKPVQATLITLGALLTTAVAQNAAQPTEAPQPAVAQPATPNEAPSVNGIPAEIIDEGKNFAPIKLDGFVADPDDKPETMRWNVTGQKDLQFTITNRVVNIKIPNPDWNGEETVTFTATDPKGASGAETVTFVVNSVNDKPTITPIPDQTINEGQSFKPIKLDDHVTDVDHPDDQIYWTADIQPIGNDKADGDLYVNIDDKRIAHFEMPDTNWYGAVKVTFTATDGDGERVASTASFTVKSINDVPIVQSSPDQVIEEGGDFNSFNLTDLVSDADDDISKLKWTVSGGNQLKASIDKYNTVSIAIPSREWYGPKETFTFTVTDSKGGSAKFNTSFTVTSVNDEPVLTQINDQTIDEGKKFTPIDLSKHVTDVDHKFEQLKWTFTGNKDLKILLQGPVANITFPDTNWHGYETINFKVTDPEGASAETVASFTVNSINDIPVLSKIADQTINEGKQFVAIRLDDLVFDADHAKSDLAWDFQVKHQGKEPAEGTLIVNVDDKRVAQVVIPDTNWNGAATITFNVTDPEGAKVSQTATFKVNSINDLPILKKIADQTVEEGNQFESVPLTDYVSDADHSLEQLKWTLTGLKSLKADIDPKTQVLTIKAPNEDWNGPTEILTLTVKDPEGGSATTSVKFTVKSVNDLPEIVKPIQSQSIDEKKQFATIDLKEVVKDRDHTPEQLKWSFAGNKALKVTIDAQRVATVVIPSLQWNGEETITFTVTDPEGAKAETQATFSVRSINDLPELKSIPNQTIAEGKTFAPIRLDDFVNDADHGKDKLTWETSIASVGSKKAAQLQVQIDANRLARVVIPDTNWYGSEMITFTVTDPEGGRASTQATFNVSSVNDLPIIGKIADQTINEGAEFALINLDALAKDADHTNDQLKWTVTGNQKLLVTVDAKARTATIKAPNKLYNGGPENLTFTVTDPEGGKANTSAKFTVRSVNNVPTLAEIPSQTIDEKKQFATIDLAKLTVDEDHAFNQLKWAVTGNKAIKVNLTPAGLATLVIPGALWHGEESITFTVTDPEGAKAQRVALFKVNSVNDLPELKKVGNQSIDEGKKFAAIDLNDLVTDADHKDEQINWKITSAPEKGKKGEEGQLKFNIDKGKLSILAPDSNWNGAEVVTFVATDPEGGKATTSALFTVRSINDIPVLTKIPNQIIEEKHAFAPIALNDLVKDADHRNDQLKWAIQGNKELKIVLDKNNQATITPPNKFWNGAESVTFTVTDPEGGKASQSVVFTVKSVNDAPMITNIKGQTIDEKKSFAAIKLDDIVKDDDHPKDRLRWAITGGKNLKATIDAKRVATIQTPNAHWNGTETLTFTVTDPENAKAEANVVFEVRSINDKPVLREIPSQEVDEGKAFRTVKLDDFVNDVDHKKDELKWTAQVVSASVAKKGKKGKPVAATESSDLKVLIDANRVATIQAPDSNWNGNRNVIFTVTDPAGATATSTVGFNVRSINDLPQIHNSVREPKVVNEGSLFPEVDLSNTVRDADHDFSRLKFAVSGQKDLKVSTAGNKLKVTVPHAQWNGKETITLTVSDPEGGKAEARIPYEVKPVNDPPVIAKIADQSIKEGATFKAIDLSTITKDPDHRYNELKWTISGAKLFKAEIRGPQLLVSAPSEDFHGGPETLTLTATDPMGAKASATATFTVTSVNDVPVIKSISPQNIREGQQFKPIRLDDYVSDVDHKNAQLNWSVSVSDPSAKPVKAKRGKAAPAPADEFKVSIDANRVAQFVLPHENWHGQRAVTFTVTDPEGGKASQTVTLNVQSVNDAPEFSKIPDQVIDEGGKFGALDLSKLVKDVDHSVSALKYDITGARELKASISSKGILTVATPNSDWYGEEKITVNVADPEGGRANQRITYSVKPVNDAPVIKGLSGQKIKEGGKFAMLELAQVATDVDNKPNELVWSASGNKDLVVEFNKSRPQARISTPNDDWSGKETIVFTVKDPKGAQASASAVFEVTSVNDAPTLSRPKDQSIDEGQKFAAIDLGKLVKDVDHSLKDLNWTLDDGQPAGKDARGRATRAKASSVKHQIRFNIDDKGVLTAAPPTEDWFGNEVVRINVWDPEGAKAHVDVKFVVKPVNDAPVITKALEDQVVNQGQAFKPIKLDEFVNDVDHKSSELRWSSNSMRFNININSARVATVQAKRSDWSGTDKVTFTVSDPLGAKTSFTTTFEVKHVNAAPEMRPIADQTVNEDTPFRAIKMTDHARDKDHKFDELKWDISGNKELVVNVDRVRQEIQIKQPREHWNGKPETITFKVTDPEGASKSVSAKFTVKPVNDPPKVISQAFQTREGEALKVSKNDGLLKGASDPDGIAPSEVMLVNRPSNGSILLERDGSFTYTPKPGFYGLDEFTFKAKDKEGSFSKVERAEINVTFRVGDVRKEDEKKAAPAPKATKKKKK